MSFRFGILALLSDAPRHGYELKTEFEQRTGGSWAVNIGQVYTTLKRLERDGLVAQAGADGGRQDYRITPAGRDQLAAWFVSPVVPDPPARDELTIKVLLAVASRDVDVTHLLQRQRTASVELLQEYTRRKARADPETDVPFLLMLDALIFRTEAEIRWLDAADARIRHMAGSNKEEKR